MSAKFSGLGVNIKSLKGIAQDAILFSIPLFIARNPRLSSMEHTYPIFFLDLLKHIVTSVIRHLGIA